MTLLRRGNEMLARANEGFVAEIERLRDNMREINRICHVPTSPGMKAYTHFQRDFDRIRELTRPYTDGQGVTDNGN